MTRATCAAPLFVLAAMVGRLCALGGCFELLASGLGAVHPTLEDPCRTSPSNQRQRVLIGHDRADTFTSRRLAMRSSVKAYNHCPKLPLAYDCIASHDIGPCPMSSL